MWIRETGAKTVSEALECNCILTKLNVSCDEMKGTDGTKAKMKIKKIE